MVPHSATSSWKFGHVPPIPIVLFMLCFSSHSAAHVVGPHLSLSAIFIKCSVPKHKLSDKCYLHQCSGVVTRMKYRLTGTNENVNASTSALGDVRVIFLKLPENKEKAEDGKMLKVNSVLT
ncbi:unnamed protein product [Sphenostylis stenocarpa]|uniref:Uncharacterized protein n=1 Tax=Sphenostylis stenocarpa TaxID=92480 RepID=A0AA86SQI8_9FABA|nr:unnamed protein product [Sphenostylis stenocarpa]